MLMLIKDFFYFIRGRQLWMLNVSPRLKNDKEDMLNLFIIINIINRKKKFHEL